MNKASTENNHKTIIINGRFLMQPTTGVQRYAYEVISAMGKIEKKQFKFIVAIPARNGVKNSYDFEISYDDSSLPPLIWQQVRLPILMKKLRADLLWSPCNIGPIFSKAHVISMHDAATFAGPEWFSPSFRTYYKTIFPLLGRIALKTLTVSNFSKKELIKHGITDERKIRVLPEGVNLEKLSPRKTNNQNSSYVLTVSSRDPRKNAKRLIQAWKLLPPHVKQERKLSDVVVVSLGPVYIWDYSFKANYIEFFLKGGFNISDDLSLLAGAGIAFSTHYEFNKTAHDSANLRRMRVKTKLVITDNSVIEKISAEKYDEDDRYFMFITNIPVNSQEIALRLSSDFRKRWRIENGYKTKKQFRGKTCSLSYAVRLFLFLLPFVLYNIWISINSKLKNRIWSGCHKYLHITASIMSFFCLVHIISKRVFIEK